MTGLRVCLRPRFFFFLSVFVLCVFFVDASAKASDAFFFFPPVGNQGWEIFSLLFFFAGVVSPPFFPVEHIIGGFPFFFLVRGWFFASFCTAKQPPLFSLPSSPNGQAGRFFFFLLVRSFRGEGFRRRPPLFCLKREFPFFFPLSRSLAFSPGRMGSRSLHSLFFPYRTGLRPFFFLFTLKIRLSLRERRSGASLSAKRPFPSSPPPGRDALR